MKVMVCVIGGGCGGVGARGAATIDLLLIVVGRNRLLMDGGKIVVANEVN